MENIKCAKCSQEMKKIGPFADVKPEGESAKKWDGSFDYNCINDSCDNCGIPVSVRFEEKDPSIIPMPEEGRMVFELMTEKNMTPSQVVEHIRAMNEMPNSHYLSTSIDNLRKILEAELRLIDIFIGKMEAKGEGAGDKTYEDRRKLAACVEACKTTPV